MKYTIWSSVIAVTLFSSCQFFLAAQDKQSQTPTSQAHPQQYHHYKLVDIGTFGGPSSSNAWAGFGNKTMNFAGAVVGEADYLLLPILIACYSPFNCFMADAFLWQNGVLTDLTGLPGNVNGTYADSINSRGRVSGVSGNGAIDPLTGYPQMDAVLWKHGKVIDLGTLGGNASAAFGINDRGPGGRSSTEYGSRSIFLPGFLPLIAAANPASMKVTRLCFSHQPHKCMQFYGRTEP